LSGLRRRNHRRGAHGEGREKKGESSKANPGAKRLKDRFFTVLDEEAETETQS